MKYTLLTVILSLGLLTSCGTETSYGNQNVQQNSGQIIENQSGWDTVDIINNRPIIAKLEQTRQETPKRDKVMLEIMERNAFKDGLFRKPTKELAEELSIQDVEGSIAIPKLIEIYGGREVFNKEGVIFFENKSQGAEQSGLWIGVKRPDERLTEFVEAMQAKVNAGEIRAEYIHIFYTPHTTAEKNRLTDQVTQQLKKLYASRGSFGVSVDIVTGEVDINHNFLSEEQKEQIKSEFPTKVFHFKQNGRMVPAQGEPDTNYPEKKFTSQYSKQGSYIMEINKSRMLVVAASPKDFSKTGGVSEFYSATYFNFPDAAKKLKVGQRVIVDASGPIMESYPGQGTALYVDVLPEYKPKTADLSESQVVAKAIKQTNNEGTLVIRNLSYHENTDVWTVDLRLGEDYNSIINIADREAK